MVHGGLEQFVPGMVNQVETDTKMYSTGKIKHFSVCQLPTSEFQ